MDLFAQKSGGVSAKMNCAERFSKAVKAKQALEKYETNPEKMEPLRYTELYAKSIRYQVEYTVCCQPRFQLLPESAK